MVHVLSLVLDLAFVLFHVTSAKVVLLVSYELSISRRVLNLISGHFVIYFETQWHYFFLLVLTKSSMTLSIYVLHIFKDMYNKKEDLVVYVEVQGITICSIIGQLEPHPMKNEVM